VIIKIEVNQAGEVTGAAIDERSTANDCIRKESLAYAKKWKFDYNEKAPKKQAGTITFTFSQQ
jgi:TonB family protein